MAVKTHPRSTSHRSVVQAHSSSHFVSFGVCEQFLLSNSHLSNVHACTGSALRQISSTQSTTHSSSLRSHRPFPHSPSSSQTGLAPSIQPCCGLSSGPFCTAEAAACVRHGKRIRNSFTRTHTTYTKEAVVTDGVVFEEPAVSLGSTDGRQTRVLRYAIIVVRYEFALEASVTEVITASKGPWAETLILACITLVFVLIAKAGTAAGTIEAAAVDASTRQTPFGVRSSIERITRLTSRAKQ